MATNVLKVLVPTDGSAHADRAVHHVAKLHAAEGRLEVHLLHVQIPITSGHARMFLSGDELDAYYREEGAKALAGARAILDAAGMPYTQHFAVGHVAETIAKFARRNGMDKIVMGSHGRTGLTHLLLGSVAEDVIKLAPVPVTVVK